MRELVDVVGIHFRFPEKIYYFSPKDYDLKIGDKVITEYDNGQRLGTVIMEKKEVDKTKLPEDMGFVVRPAKYKDIEYSKRVQAEEPNLLRRCKEKVEEMGLEMKLIDCEYFYDKRKILFYFTADGRVDFRELVKELGSMFHARIQLMQVGARDELKIMGGIGPCGQEVCCRTFLREFSPVTIKMAKEQNLSLNQSKISGACGRLMCCLNSEFETYELYNQTLPKKGTQVTTIDGIKGVVDTVNVLRKRVRVIVDTDGDTKEIKEFPSESLIFDKKDSIGEENKHIKLDESEAFDE